MMNFISYFPPLSNSLPPVERGWFSVIGFLLSPRGRGCPERAERVEGQERGHQ